MSSVSFLTVIDIHIQPVIEQNTNYQPIMMQLAGISGLENVHCGCAGAYGSAPDAQTLPVSCCSIYASHTSTVLGLSWCGLVREK